MGDMMTGFGWGLAAAANQGTSVVINTDPDVFLRVWKGTKMGSSSCPNRESCARSIAI